MFGDVVDGIMHLNDLGRAADLFWKEIPRHFPQVELDEYVVMPNHVHGIIQIVNHVKPDALHTVCAVGIPIVSGINMPDEGNSLGNMRPHVWDVGANDYSPLRNPNRVVQYPGRIHFNPRGTSRTLGSMVRGFKIGVTLHARGHGFIGDVWQRNYFDHIIRSQRSFERIRVYIRDNPKNWSRDRNNPDRPSAP